MGVYRLGNGEGGRSKVKLSDKHVYFNGLCCGCQAAVKQEDVDPDSLYLQRLCPRCQAELEELPLRHKEVFKRLKEEMDKVAGKVSYLEGVIAVLEGFIIAHGLDPQAADDSYVAYSPQGRKG